MIKVYAAGPMEGLSHEEMTGWRNVFKDMAEVNGDIHVIDPTRRAPFHKDSSMSMARTIVKLDLMDIDNSDVVFLDMRRGKGRAWGTAMELMYAHTKGKPIIVWEAAGDFPHPFIEALCTVKVTSIKEAVEWLELYND